MKKIIILFVVVLFILDSNSQQQSGDKVTAHKEAGQADMDITKWKMTDLENYLKKSDVPVVVNFWATFCKPCVEEIPWFEEITAKYKDQKVKLLLVSLDLPAFYPARIANFAKNSKFESEIVWLDEMNADYFCPKIDSSWSGAIPATLIINHKTGYRKFFGEQMRPQFLEARIKDALN